MNAPDRHERFVLPEDQRKVEYSRDTKVLNAAKFILNREDHTLGNLIRMRLHEDPNVLFVGYRLPHPLQYNMEVKIQTSKASTPVQAYNKAIDSLIEELNRIQGLFEAELPNAGKDFY